MVMAVQVKHAMDEQEDDLVADGVAQLRGLPLRLFVRQDDFPVAVLLDVPER